ncbi:hypothetical protein IFO70_16055 [Phormidium tenue FACHB-886]|nr:hypothetical protein [Phormidium tenue FACHB-886]
MSDTVQPIWSFISSAFDGTSAFVYLWISKKWRVIYVGQTNDRKGSFGRAFSHIQDNGTLRTRFEEQVGTKLEAADDLILVSYPLPKEPEYTSEESSYREAIEYLVQIGLRDVRGEVKPKFNLISNVRTVERTSNPSLKRYADKIVKNFLEVYPKF